MAEPGYDVFYPRGNAAAALDGARRRLQPLLVPASWLYAAGSDTFRRIRSLDRGDTPAGVTVVSVGNLEVGGSGKTPLCIHLLEEAIAAGRPAAYVSRGYGSPAARFDGVTLVGDPWRGAPGTRWLPRELPGLAAAVGDEGAVVAERVPQARLAFSRDKGRAIEFIADDLSGGVVVLDDAFQSWGAPRNLDVVLVDPRRPFGDGRLLPAGRLREVPDALLRADVVVFNGSVEADVEERMRARVGAVKSLVLTRDVVVDVPAAEEVVVASAIARPAGFERCLTKHGIRVAAALRFPDHHRYRAADVAGIIDVAAGRRIVVTEKDWVKLRDLGCDESAFAVARLDTRLSGRILGWD